MTGGKSQCAKDIDEFRKGDERRNVTYRWRMKICSRRFVCTVVSLMTALRLNAGVQIWDRSDSCSVRRSEARRLEGHVQGIPEFMSNVGGSDMKRGH